MKTTAHNEVYTTVTLTANKQVESQVLVSDAESEATTWSVTDPDRIMSQVERVIYSITLKG
jgi:hypothetical protein